MVTWSKYKLNELGFVGRGKSKHRPRNAPKLYGGDYPFVQTADIKQAILNLTTYSQTYNDVGLAQSKLWDSGTLCITIAANIAETAILGIKACFPDSIVGFIADGRKSDVRFIKYYIDTIKLRMQNISKGTTQDNLSVDKLLSFDFCVPPVEMQRRIATIISNYDNLIENNNRRIKILEEMAQTIYNEWFVKFRFPGHGKVKMVASELGKIPDGWQTLSFTDCIDVLSGGTPKTTVADYWNGNIPFFTPKDAGNHFYVTDTEKHISELGLKKCNSKLYGENTVFITARGTVGKVVLAGEDMAMNQSCYALVGKESLSQFFVFCMTKSLIDYLKTNTGGATFDTIIVDTFRRLKIVFPNKTVIRLFDGTIEALFKEVLVLMNKNRNLQKSRDILLPRLISGEIDIENMDIDIGEINDR